jgi:hypothetical protein
VIQEAFSPEKTQQEVLYEKNNGSDPGGDGYRDGAGSGRTGQVQRRRGDQVSAGYRGRQLTVSGSVYTLKLLGEAGLGGGWSLYARLGAQSVTNPSLTDFNTGAGVYGEN